MVSWYDWFVCVCVGVCVCACVWFQKYSLDKMITTYIKKRKYQISPPNSSSFWRKKKKLYINSAIVLKNSTKTCTYKMPHTPPISTCKILVLPCIENSSKIVRLPFSLPTIIKLNISEYLSKFVPCPFPPPPYQTEPSSKRRIQDFIRGVGTWVRWSRFPCRHT